MIVLLKNKDAMRRMNLPPLPISFFLNYVLLLVTLLSLIRVLSYYK